MLFDVATVGVVAPRWLFALACRAGVELGPAAVQKGCHAFAGYDDILRFPARLSEDEIVATVEPVLVVPLLLADGVDDDARIRRALFDALSASKLLALDDARFFLVAFAQQLLEVRIIRRGPADGDGRP